MTSFNPQRSKKWVNLPVLTETSEYFELNVPKSPQVMKWNFRSLKIAKNKPRLILIGESVASAYFYRPHQTFGKLLKDFFPHFEIVDLSMVDFPFWELGCFEEIVKRMNPERLVIFAGNNLGNDFDEASVNEKLKSMLKIYQAKRIDYILPIFNNRDWHPLEIRTNSSSVFRRLENGQVNESDSSRCPMVNFLKGNENARWDSYVGLEDLTPGIRSSLRKAIKSTCGELGISVLDCAHALTSDDLLDYCHVRLEGLHKLVQILAGEARSFVEEKNAEREALRQAFLHCWLSGRFKMATRHLKSLKDLMPEGEFQKFTSSFAEAIFSNTFPCFLNAINEYPLTVSIRYKIFYPPREVYTALKAVEPKLTYPVRASRDLNLLDFKRCLQSHRHQYASATQEPFLAYQGYFPVFKTYFLGAELKSKSLRLRSRIEIPVSLLRKYQEIRLCLNGTTLQILEPSAWIETDVTFSGTDEYNEVSIEVIVDEEPKSIPEALFMIHQLKIYS